RRRAIARRRSGRHAGGDRSDRATPSWHHLGGRSLDQRPALRRHPHFVPELGRVSFERRGDLRYVGQGYELRVPFPDGPIDAASLTKAFDAFHEIHRREYGHHFADSAIEIVNLRLVGAASAATIAKPSVGTATSLEAAKVRTGTCTFR